MSHNNIEAVVLETPESSLENIYLIDVSNNQIRNLEGWEDYFPDVTVINVSNNQLLGECDLDCMAYMDSVAEIDVAGNDFFVPGCENDLHERFPFLERINRRKYFTAGERERRKKEEILQYFNDKQLLPNDEIEELRQRQDRIREIEGQMKIVEEEGELDDLDMVLLRCDAEEAARFKKNAADLEEFGENYVQDFTNIYSMFKESSEKANNSILDYQIKMNKHFEELGLDAPFKIDLPKEKYTKIDAEMEEAETIGESKETPKTQEMKKDPSSVQVSMNSLFETKPQTPSTKAEIKTGSFRLRTYSRDQLGSKKGEQSTASIQSNQFGTGTGLGTTQKVHINWAQKDLKKQNEEIQRMLERTRKDPAPLQRVPKKLADQGTMAAKKLWP
jgi:hypothetical protein